ncbi:hypothetical protein ACA910_000213 [Epithemia clementina (nom. ined.)]
MSLQQSLTSRFHDATHPRPIQNLVGSISIGGGGDDDDAVITKSKSDGDDDMSSKVPKDYSEEALVWSRIQTALDLRAGCISSSAVELVGPNGKSTTRASDPASNDSNHFHRPEREKGQEATAQHRQSSILWWKLGWILSCTPIISFGSFGFACGLFNFMVKCLARGLDSSLLTSPTPVNPTSPLVESAPPSLLVPPSIAVGVGPLVASHVVAIVLSMLLATKTTATLTILQNRRQSVHSLLLHEEHYLRQLKALTMSPLLEQLVSKTERVVPLDCLDLLWSNLQQESQRRCSNNKLPAAAAAKRLDGRGGGKDPHQFIEYDPGRLLALLAQMEMDFIHRQADKSRQWEPYLIQMRQLIQQVRQQRLIVGSIAGKCKFQSDST